jgi:hypothetical protein
MTITRDQKFRDTFDDFFLTYFHGELNYYNSLKLLTKNTKKNLHEYELSIPTKYVIGEITNDIFDNENRLIHPKKILYSLQVLPNFGDFESKFLDYFDKYRLIEGNRLVSWTKIYSINVLDDNLENPCFRTIIDVCYYKKHSPYPIKTVLDNINHMYNKLLQEHNLLLEENDSLLGEIHDCYNENSFLRRKIKKMNIRHSNNHNRMTNKMIDLIEENNMFDDCPVCYEKMNSETIIIPGCCHYICQTCVDKCQNCPMCREKYCFTRDKK